MTFFVEGVRNGEFLVDVPTPDISFAAESVSTAATLQSGTPLGKVTATGLYEQLNPTATDGSQTLAGFLVNKVYADSTVTSINATVLVRGPASVSSAWGRIPYPTGWTLATMQTAAAALGGGGIVVRD